MTKAEAKKTRRTEIKKDIAICNRLLEQLGVKEFENRYAATQLIELLKEAHAKLKR